MSTERSQQTTQGEGLLALAYCAAYLGYLFRQPENELRHWMSLVLLPLALLFIFRRGAARRPRSVFASVGLRRGNLRAGLLWAILLGLALSALQLVVSRQAGEIWEIIVSGRALWLFPLSFSLMFLTAAFTEEFFFRGFLQTRLETLLRSRWAALAVATILFGIYHLPYAYLNPNWPSAGDWSAAWSAALGQGLPGGLLLGLVYIFTNRNLLACVIVHALINSLPAMGMIHFG